MGYYQRHRQNQEFQFSKEVYEYVKIWVLVAIVPGLCKHYSFNLLFILCHVATFEIQSLFSIFTQLSRRLTGEHSVIVGLLNEFFENKMTSSFGRINLVSN